MSRKGFDEGIAQYGLKAMMKVEELIRYGITIELPIEVINGEINITKKTFESIVLHIY